MSRGRWRGVAQTKLARYRGQGGDDGQAEVRRALVVRVHDTVHKHETEPFIGLCDFGGVPQTPKPSLL